MLETLQSSIELIVNTTAVAELGVARLASGGQLGGYLGVRVRVGGHEGWQEALLLEEFVVDDFGRRATLS